MHICSRRNAAWFIGLTVLVTFAVAQTVFAQKRTVETFCGSETAYVGDINDMRVVVGTQAVDIEPFAFIRYPDGTFSTFDVPIQGCGTESYDVFTTAWGINNKGMIVGTTLCMSNYQGTFGYMRLQDGSAVFLTDPHGSVRPRGINDSGQITGVINPSDGSGQLGFLRDIAGQTTYLTYEGVGLSPWGINNAGTVVGTFNDQGFIYANGKLEFVQYADHHGNKFPTGFLDVNNAGEILGYYKVAESNYQFFVFSKRKFKALKLPELTDVGASAFNAFGDVAGGWYDYDQVAMKCFVAYRLAK